MSELVRAVAIGNALIDEKMLAAGIALPSADYEAAQMFLAEHTTVSSAGGSVANTMAAFGAYGPHTAKLYYTVGPDMRGHRFIEDSYRLVGSGAMSNLGHTGFCVIALSPQGEINDEITVYGVAREAEIPRHEMRERQNGLVVANFNTIRHSRTAEQVQHLLRFTLDRRGGLFAFRLSGAHATMAGQTTVRSVMGKLPRTPHIVFANEHELANFAGCDTRTAIETVLPDSRLVVVTQGGKEVLARFEDQDIISVAVPPTRSVVDTTGAGDQFMGVMLAELQSQRYADWTSSDVRRAIIRGIVASSQVVQTFNSRVPQTRGSVSLIHQGAH